MNIAASRSTRATTRSDERTQQYLTFFIADDEYAIGILRLREVIEYRSVTRVPSTPEFVCGVINLRGDVLPVLDLGVKFGMAKCSPTKRTCIVVVDSALDGQPIAVGILTDSVNQVIDLLSDDVKEPPPFGTGIQVDYLEGMALVEESFVLLLDIDRALSATDLMLAAGASEADLGDDESSPESGSEAADEVEPSRMDEEPWNAMPDDSDALFTSPDEPQLFIEELPAEAIETADEEGDPGEDDEATASPPDEHDEDE